MNKKITILLIIIFFLIGFGTGKVLEKRAWQAKWQVAQEEIFRAQEYIDWLKTQGVSRLLPEEVSTPGGEEVYEFWGTVTETGDGFLAVRGVFPEEQEAQVIKVNITEETEIFRLEESAKVFLNFEDIETGEIVHVTSKENIRGEEEIIAGQLQVVYRD